MRNTTVVCTWPRDPLELESSFSRGRQWLVATGVTLRIVARHAISEWVEGRVSSEELDRFPCHVREDFHAMFMTSRMFRSDPLYPRPTEALVISVHG